MASLAGGVVGMAHAQEPDLEREGVEAFKAFDFDSAVEKLQAASKAGKNVTSVLAQARLQAALWQGLEAEAAGLASKAEESFKVASAYAKGAEAQAALGRLKTQAVKPAAEWLLLEANDQDTSSSKLDHDFTQRAAIAVLKHLEDHSSNLDLSPLKLKDYSLGCGVDIVTGERRESAVVGAAADPEDGYEERLVVSETTSSEENNVQIDHSLGQSLDAEYGVLGFGLKGSHDTSLKSVQETKTASLTYTFRLSFEVVKQKRTIKQPSLAAPFNSVAELVHKHGTHFVAEAWEGAAMYIECTAKCSSLKERHNVSESLKTSVGGKYGVVGGGVSMDTSTATALDSMAKNASMTFKMDATGVAGAPAQSFEAFLARRERFVAETKALKPSACKLVRVQLKPYCDLAGAPGLKARLESAVKRRYAARVAETMLASARTKGAFDLEDGPERAAESLKQIEEALANDKTKPFKWYYNSEVLSIDRFPKEAVIAIEDVTLKTHENNVILFLLPAAVFQEYKSSGALNKKLTAAQLQDLGARSLFWQNSSKQGTSTKGLFLVPNDWNVLVVNFNAAANATVSYTFKLKNELTAEAGFADGVRQRGLEAAKQNDLDECARLHQKVLRLADSDPQLKQDNVWRFIRGQAHRVLAIVHAVRKESPLALEDVEKSLEAWPSGVQEVEKNAALQSVAGEARFKDAIERAKKANGGK
jgi:hypothetical protein